MKAYFYLAGNSFWVWTNVNGWRCFPHVERGISYIKQYSILSYFNLVVWVTGQCWDLVQPYLSTVQLVDWHGSPDNHRQHAVCRELAWWNGCLPGERCKIIWLEDHHPLSFLGRLWRSFSDQGKRTLWGLRSGLFRKRMCQGIPSWNIRQYLRYKWKVLLFCACV